MPSEREPRIAEPYSGGDGASGPERAPTTRRRGWRRALILIAAGLVLVLLAVGTTYLVGGFKDGGRFRAEPPACATLAPSLHLLGAAYTTQQTGNNGCSLLLPLDDPNYVPSPVIQVEYSVTTSRWGSAPDGASRVLRDSGRKLNFQALPGVGDEAYLWNENVMLRVSNLVIGIIVYPRRASTQDQVRAFAADLANRLRNG